MSPADTLASFVDYYRHTSPEFVSDSYAGQLRNAVGLLDRYAGHRVRLGDLSDALVSGFVDWLFDHGRAAATVRGRRNAILAMWRWAFQEEIIEIMPLRVRRIRERRSLPRAWTAAEVRRLVDTALADQVVTRSGLTRGLWFGSLVAAGWDTALRLGDLLRLEVSTATAAAFVVTQHKTLDDLVCQFSGRTLALIEETLAEGPRSLIWPLWSRREQFYVHFRRLVARAAVRPGTFRFIRRGAITSVEAHGGNGSLLAGHRSRQTTDRHYIDVSQLTRPRPEALFK